MWVGGQLCLLCNTFVFSRADHDYMSCSCGALHVDGGQEEHGGMSAQKLPDGSMCGMRLQVLITATKKTLYQDWNHRKDQWGRIDLANIHTFRTNEENMKKSWKLKILVWLLKKLDVKDSMRVYFIWKINHRRLLDELHQHTGTASD